MATVAGSSNDRSTIIANFLVGVLDAAKGTLGVGTVLYGTHSKIPSGITVTVNPGTKIRSLRTINKPGGGTLNLMQVIVTVYSNKIGAEATERKSIEEISEDVEAEIHKDTTFGGNATHGFVETWNPGFEFRPNSEFRVVQMIVVCQSTSQLTPTP